MKVRLLSHTPDLDCVIATAVHQCVSDDDAQEFFERLKRKHPRHANLYISKAMKMGHTSVLEHANFTFAISGVSRSLTHQLVRFRIASYSQQSQRYVSFEPGELPHTIPPTIQADDVALREFEDFMVTASEMYQFLLGRGIPAEDARFVAPNATDTALILTMNARELLHAFSVRDCEHAQWEIRDMFREMLRLCKRTNSVIFARAGAACLRGPCPEGTRCCGRVNSVATEG